MRGCVHHTSIDRPVSANAATQKAQKRSYNASHYWSRHQLGSYKCLIIEHYSWMLCNYISFNLRNGSMHCDNWTCLAARQTARRISVLLFSVFGKGWHIPEDQVLARISLKIKGQEIRGRPVCKRARTIIHTYRSHHLCYGVYIHITRWNLTTQYMIHGMESP
jgi:hypothetical protein